LKLKIFNLGLGTWVTFSAPIPEDVAEDIVVMAFEVFKKKSHRTKFCFKQWLTEMVNEKFI
jgi:hypothetical protein